MRRLAAWGLCTSALAGVGLASAADPAPPKPWYARLTGASTPTPPTAPPPATPAPTFAEIPPLRSVGPLDPVVLNQAFKAERDAWDRRMEVCRRLREVAAAANDDALTRQANTLEQQVTALYEARVARLGIKTPRRTPADSQAAADETAAYTPAPFKVVTP